jgi:hypothetical protein
LYDRVIWTCNGCLTLRTFRSILPRQFS